MKSGKQKQKVLDILTTATSTLLENSSRLKKYQNEINDVLENACDMESRQEILNILLLSKQKELMESFSRLEYLMASRYTK